MGYLDKVVVGSAMRCRRLFVYGEPGIGKSTFAAQAIKPLFLDCEDGLNDIAPARVRITSWLDFVGVLCELTGSIKHDYQTLVIDSADRLEKMCWASVVADEKNSKWKTIGDIPFQRGFESAADRLRSQLPHLDALRDKKMFVVVIAHSAPIRITPPDNVAYDKYAPRLHKHARDAWTEWADEVFFMHRRVNLQVEDEGFGRDRGIARSIGDRVLHCSETPYAHAKNRCGLPDVMEPSWKVYLDVVRNHYQKGSSDE